MAASMAARQLSNDTAKLKLEKEKVRHKNIMKEIEALKKAGIKSYVRGDGNDWKHGKMD